ncbi:hypothetical protein FACS1894170_10100 [Planctomycetales bacterium]|nr:hypothetical protein FACS1894170_10100 [Planctomycetales bacterium]
MTIMEYSPNHPNPMKKLHVLYLSVALVFITWAVTAFVMSLPETTFELEKEHIKAAYLLLKIECQLGITDLDKNDYNFWSYLYDSGEYHQGYSNIVLFYHRAKGYEKQLKEQGRYTEAKLFYDYQKWLVNNPVFHEECERVDKYYAWTQKRNAYLFWWYPKNKE